MVDWHQQSTSDVWILASVYVVGSQGILLGLVHTSILDPQVALKAERLTLDQLVMNLNHQKKTLQSTHILGSQLSNYHLGSTIDIWSSSICHPSLPKLSCPLLPVPSRGTSTSRFWVIWLLCRLQVRNEIWSSVWENRPPPTYTDRW